MELFGSHSELRRWIWSESDYSDLLRQLPSDNVSLQKLAGEIVRGLDRRGVLPSVFPRLETAFPGRAMEIASLARGAGVVPFERSPPSSRRALVLGALGFLVASLLTLALSEHGMNGGAQPEISEAASIKPADRSLDSPVVQNDADRQSGGLNNGVDDHAKTPGPAMKPRTTYSKVMRSIHETDIKRDGAGYLDARTKAQAVPHGLRSCFRVWVTERTNFDGDMAEIALAHMVGSKVRQAYDRSDMIEKRRVMMAAWGRFLRGEHEAKIVQMERSSA